MKGIPDKFKKKKWKNKCGTLFGKGKLIRLKEMYVV
jgi:hypothetical protein